MWYHLLTAEGGTSWEHRAAVARSRNLFGSGTCPSAKATARVPWAGRLSGSWAGRQAKRPVGGPAG
ncbi:hypothetical protein [Allorhizocola rhizosphaerae]|uniref:hypothetical protein n=1 Tax=Allorhizocola rhizosphaerae TaxID=1872709 RepID=UPI000E3DA713|nr:hypothetical protein [Allorhizocola rhizosphaerae]